MLPISPKLLEVAFGVITIGSLGFLGIYYSILAYRKHKGEGRGNVETAKKDENISSSASPQGHKERRRK